MILQSTHFFWTLHRPTSIRINHKKSQVICTKQKGTLHSIMLLQRIQNESIMLLQRVQNEKDIRGNITKTTGGISIIFLIFNYIIRNKVTLLYSMIWTDRQKLITVFQSLRKSTCPQSQAHGSSLDPSHQIHEAVGGIKITLKPPKPLICVSYVYKTNNVSPLLKHLCLSTFVTHKLDHYTLEKDSTVSTFTWLSIHFNPIAAEHSFLEALLNQSRL